MSKSKLPPQGTAEAEAVIERFLSGDLTSLSAELNYTRRDLLVRAMKSKYGVVQELAKIKVGPPPEPKVYPAPKIKIMPLIQEGDKEEGEEVHLTLRSDAHVGLLTPSFNIATFKDRLWTLAKAETNICRLHRRMRPIKKLVSPWLGDMVQGEQYGVQGYVEEFECGVEEQIYEHLVPTMAEYYVNLLQIYETIEIPIVPGNHGNIQRRSQKVSKRSHWDTVAGRALKSALSHYEDRIHVTVAEPGQWYMIQEVNGWSFLLIHLDQILSYQGVPFYGIEKRGLRWKQSIGVTEPFDYILGGHFHNPNALYNAGVPIYINGTFSSDSDFPLVRMGLKDVAAQWSLFVNRKYGVTASYKISLQEGQRNV